MLKRIFWLTLAAVAAWLIWTRLRQRQNELAATTPQFAPPQPFGGPASAPSPPPAMPPQPTPPATSAAPAGPDEAPETAPTAPAANTPPEQVALGAPEAPPHEVGETTDLPAAEDSATRQRAPESDTPTAEAMPGAAEPPSAAATAVTTANENERATADVSNAAPPEGARLLDEEVVGYCVRCKTKRPIKDAHEETTESGRRAARGTCPVCGANMFTFLATSDEDPTANRQS
jgi:hypothetical protein